MILRIGNQDLLLSAEIPAGGAAIPEPASLGLLGLGLVGLAAARRRRRVVR